MPYIKQAQRDVIAKGWEPDNPGELNYLLTTIIQRYWTRTTNYRAINDIVGALESVKLEFYSRIARPYEDTKLEQNGDVYPPRLSPPNQEIYDGVYGK